jgi:hypothetical protein
MAVKKATWSQKSTGDILHPETEVDQLKSTGSNALATIITTLLKAATTSEARSAIESAAAVHQHSTGDIQSFASNVITAIGEETLAALGVRYSITTNGYICFGQLFGGLILQWAYPVIAPTTEMHRSSASSDAYVSLTRPISCIKLIDIVGSCGAGGDMGDFYGIVFKWNSLVASYEKLNLFAYSVTKSDGVYANSIMGSVHVMYISIGKES